jgi:hypothetical protein
MPRKFCQCVEDFDWVDFLAVCFFFAAAGALLVAEEVLCGFCAGLADEVDGADLLAGAGAAELCAEPFAAAVCEDLAAVDSVPRWRECVERGAAEGSAM